MHFVECDAPHGAIDPAPMTSAPRTADATLIAPTAFWTEDGSYRLRVEGSGTSSWYRMDADGGGELPTDLGARMAMSNFLSNVTSIGRGRVLFPVGSTGRRVYRVWRGNRDGVLARTRILAVRVAQLRRRPA